MITIKTTLSKLKHHMSQKEFKQIESIGLSKFVLVIVNICLFAIGLMLLRYVTVDVLNDLRQSIPISEEKILFNEVSNVLYGLFQVILFGILSYILFLNVVKMNYALFVKNAIYGLILFSIIQLPIYISPTALVLFLYIFLGIGFFLKRLIYIKKLYLLRDLYIISPTSKFGFFKRSKLNYIVYSPNQLMQINKKWLPFVDVQLDGRSYSRLSTDWEGPVATDAFYDVVVQSRFSGIKLKQSVTSIETEEGYLIGKGGED